MSKNGMFSFSRGLAVIIAFIIPLSIFASDTEELIKGAEVHEGEYDAATAIMHHISDEYKFHIVGDVNLYLPVIIYDEELRIFSSSRFYKNEHHVEHDLEGETHFYHFYTFENYMIYEGSIYHGTELKMNEFGEIANEKLFWEFSITKNVFSIIVAAIIMMIIFLMVAKGYKKRKGKSPKGIQSLLEPLIIFLRDEVIKPNIGHNYYKYFPFLMTIFFFIWINNMLGLVPIFPGSANVTGNISVTFSLAVMTMIVTNFSANKQYWQHIFWMPGVPIPVKLLLAPIEFIQIFTKPGALMIRLFANITAGHIIVLSLASLIFIFGEAGESLGGGIAGIAMAVPFLLFMFTLELLVAFIQAFIFTILSALFIGQAIEEHH